MHELSIALAIQREARAAAGQHLNAGRLCRVRVAVGELAGVEITQLKQAWQLLEPQTMLEVQPRTADLRCAGCRASHARATDGGWIHLCERCGMPLHVVGGDELDLLQVETETGEKDHEAKH